MKRILLSAVFLIFCSFLMSITLMSWECSSLAGNESSCSASVIGSHVSNVSPSGVLSRGSGLNAASKSGRFNANNWGLDTIASAITGSDYMTYTIQAEAGYVLAIDSLGWNWGRSSTGPTTYELRSSIDNYATTLGAWSVSSSSTSIKFKKVIGSSLQAVSTITFRLYGAGASSTVGSGGFEGSGADLVIYGTASPNFTVPTIVTMNSSNVGAATFTANGQVTNDGGVSLTEKGFLVSLSSDPQPDGTGVTKYQAEENTVGSYSLIMNNLEPETLYYYRAYAVNIAGTSLGEVITVSTTALPAPTNVRADDVTQTTFTAKWDTVHGATSYVIDVATDSLWGVGQTNTIVSEAFLNGTTVPAGWTYQGINSTYTSSSYYGAASPSLKFEDTGDVVTTPTLTSPATLSFWVRGSVLDSSSIFYVEGYRNATWETLLSMKTNGTGNSLINNIGTTHSISLDVATTKVRFRFYKSGGNVALDDVVIKSNYNDTVFLSNYHDLSVTGNQITVSGLTEDATYFFRVKAAHTSGKTSGWGQTVSATPHNTGIVLGPDNFTAITNGQSIQLNWDLNPLSQSVLLAYSPSGTFGTPTGNYIAGNSIAGGGTVLYAGTATAFIHSGLTAQTQYHYSIWAYDTNSHYSSAQTVTALTAPTATSRLKVHFIDVRQGDSALIENNGSYYLIDAGKNLSENKVITYLTGLGVTHLNGFLITHPDFDHYGEGPDLLSSSIAVDHFYRNTDTSDAQTYASLISLLASHNVPTTIVDSNTQLNWTVSTKVLNPTPAKSENDNSIVFQMQYGDMKFLFTGDMELSTINRLLNTYDLDSDVLKVSHHGSSNGTTAALATEVSPKISVISAGNNSYGHPALSVIQILQQAGSTIYSTADDWQSGPSSDSSIDDDVVVETDGASLWVNGSWVWTKPSSSLTSPTPLQIAYQSANITLTWPVVPNAVSYRIEASTTPQFSSYSDVTSSGNLGTTSGLLTWSVSASQSKMFYRVIAIR